MIRKVSAIVLLCSVLLLVRDSSQRPMDFRSPSLDPRGPESTLYLPIGDGSKDLPILDTLLRMLMRWYSPVQAKGELCRNHSNAYLEAVLAKDMWGLQMFDASTKIPNSLIEGNIRHLGDFDECLKIEVKLNDTFEFESQSFKGKHCLVNFAAASSSTTSNNFIMSLLSRHLARREDERNNGQLSDTILGTMGAQWAFCIPSSCSAKDLQTHWQNTLGPNISAFVNPMTCSVREEIIFESKDWGMTAFLIFFAVLIVGSTGYDLIFHRNSKGQPSSILLAFSVYSNGKRLLSTTSSAQTMSCLNGLRFLSMAWVIIGHKYYSVIFSPVSNAIDLLDLPKHWLNMTLMNAFLSVDTFLFLSGFLLVYVFLNEVQRTKRFNVIFFYVYRYLRLTPAFAVVIGIYATLFYYVGDGPMWESVVGTIRGNCSLSWWKSLTYLNNYPFMANIDSSQECVMQAWYLYVDMQLYWLSPLFLYPLWRWPKYGLVALSVAIVGSIAIPFTLTLEKSLPWTVDYFNMKNFFEFMEYIYNPTYSRATPYFVGILAGYILHKHRQSPYNLTKFVIYGGWTLCTAVCLTVVYSLSIYYNEGHEYNAVEAAFYAAFHRFAWAVGIGWLVFACITGHGGPIDAILSWKVFQPLSRLTYCAYLTHFMVLNYEMGTARVPTHYSSYTVVISYLGNLTLILVLATILTLTFESPILIIEKALLKKGSQGRPGGQESNNGKKNGHTNEAFTEDNSPQTEEKK